MLVSRLEGIADRIADIPVQVEDANTATHAAYALRDALILMSRLYNGKADGRELPDDGSVVEWMDEEIATYIRKHGPLPKT